MITNSENVLFPLKSFPILENLRCFSEFLMIHFQGFVQNRVLLEQLSKSVKFLNIDGFERRGEIAKKKPP